MHVYFVFYSLKKSFILIDVKLQLDLVCAVCAHVHCRLNPHAVHRLVAMVTSLGTLSITYAELKQLIKSLKVEDNAEPHPYTSALMQAMSGQC